MSKPAPRIEVGQPSTRVYIREVDPRIIQNARFTSDFGSFRIASELAEIFGNDPRVEAALAQRVDGVLRLPKIVKHPSKRIEKALLEDLPQMLPESEHSLWIRRAIMGGLGLAQIRWITGRSGRMIPSIESWSTSGLQRQLGQWKLEVEPTPGTGATELRTIVFGAESQWQWLMLFPFGQNRPMFRGLWNKLAEILSLKSFSIKDWAGYSEYHGRGNRVLEQLEATNPESPRFDGAQLGELAGKVDSATAGQTIGLPQGVKLSLLEATSNNWQLFPKAMEVAATEIALAICGQNLTSEVKGGSRAAATVHESVQSELVAGTATLDSEHAVGPLIEAWELMNYGSVTQGVFSYNTKPPDDSLVRASLEKTTAEALTLFAAIPGLGVDGRKICEERGIPISEVAPSVVVQVPAKLSAASERDDVPISVVQGQLALDSMPNIVQSGLEPTIDKLITAISGASDYESLRAKLMQLYHGLDTDALAEVMHRSLALATAAGAFYARKDGDG